MGFQISESVIESQIPGAALTREQLQLGHCSRHVRLGELKQPTAEPLALQIWSHDQAPQLGYMGIVRCQMQTNSSN